MLIYWRVLYILIESIYYHLVMTNIAMENGPCIDGLPIKNGLPILYTIYNYRHIGTRRYDQIPGFHHMTNTEKDVHKKTHGPEVFSV